MAEIPIIEWLGLSLVLGQQIQTKVESQSSEIAPEFLTVFQLR